MQVHANRDMCVSSGQCVMTAPDVFDQDEDEGVVVLKTGSPSPELAPDIRRAAAMCPAMAISITDK